MITSKDLDQLLIKVQKAPQERVRAYSHCFEGLFPGDPPEDVWHDLDNEDASALRAALRLGLLTETAVSWTADWPEEYCPDGCDYMVSLTGMGTDRLLRLNEPWWASQLRSAKENVVTIAISVVTTIAGAYLLKALGLTQ